MLQPCQGRGTEPVPEVTDEGGVVTLLNMDTSKK